MLKMSPLLSSGELQAILTDPHYTKLLQSKNVYVYRNALVHETIEHFEDYDELMPKVSGKPYLRACKKGTITLCG